MATIPRLSTEWIVRFTYRPTASITATCNIIHLSYSGRYQRVPAFFFKYDSGTVELQIQSNYLDSNSKISTVYNEQVVVPNQPTTVEIHQRYISGGRYRFFVIRDGEEIHSHVNNQVQQFYNVKVFASNDWFLACPGYISNFSLTNFL